MKPNEDPEGNFRNTKLMQVLYDDASETKDAHALQARSSDKPDCTIKVLD